MRGTVPTPEVGKLEYGGNTICLAAALSEEEYLILDCGSGLRLLGKELVTNAPDVPRHFHIFLSHYHFDHVEGLPFFQPLYGANSTVTIYAAPSCGRTVRQIMETLIAPPYFPVNLAGVPAKVNFVEIDGSPRTIADVQVSTLPLHHPDGSICYRLEHAGRRIIFATDHEHGHEETDQALVRFSEGADFLIYDATYIPAEYESLRRGWGHSTWYAAVQAAQAAKVKTLVLFHHHPDHTDENLGEILRVAREELPATEVAREGLELPF